ncbi:MAG: coproporphyrinogen-III oxidase family protein [Spirochaetota bacterium]
MISCAARPPRLRLDGHPLNTCDTSLYVHVPFCRSRCDYCSFYSNVAGSNDNLDSFHERIEEELREMTMLFPRATVTTVYLGGGTPSALGPRRLEELLVLLEAAIVRTAGGSTAGRTGGCSAGSGVREWTVEVNPEDLTEDLISMLRSSPVTRLSLGVQSLDPVIRKRIGRRGGAASTLRALQLLERLWPHGSSVDLISGVPGQGRDSAEEDVRIVAGHGIGHLSIYALSVEPDTEIARRFGGVWPDRADATATGAWSAAIDRARAAGFDRYEVSNFALPGERCLHNQRFWEAKPYVGLGPSAVSTFWLDHAGQLPPEAAAAPSTRGSAGGRAAVRAREGRPRAVRRRRGEERRSEWELLGVRELFLEYLMLRLRTSDGLSVSALARSFGIDPDSLFPDSLESLQALQERGFLRLLRGGGERCGRTERIVPTERGFRFLDGVIAEVVEALEGQLDTAMGKW